jgi:hypothetical protein
VKTHIARISLKIDLSERAVFNYFRVGKGQMTLETEMASRFHTASVATCRLKAKVSGPVAVVGGPSLTLTKAGPSHQELQGSTVEHTVSLPAS